MDSEQISLKAEVTTNRNAPQWMLGQGRGTVKEGLILSLPPLMAEPKHIRGRGPPRFNGAPKLAFSIRGWEAPLRFLCRKAHAASGWVSASGTDN